MRRAGERGQTSFELVLFVGFVFLVTFIIVSPYMQTMDETKALAIIKSRAIDLVSQQEQRYSVHFVERTGEESFMVTVRPDSRFDTEAFSSRMPSVLAEHTGFDSAVVEVKFAD